MANVRKRISELTPLTSASLDTTIVGVDNGTTYKIELDVLADAVSNRVNTLDRNRLDSIESITSSFETKGRSILSGSVSYTSLTNIPQGIVSQSTDLSSLNQFTSSISTASLVTSINNLNTFTASQSTSSLVDRLNAIENVSGSWITESETGSFLTSLNGAISSSVQVLGGSGVASGSYETTGRSIISSSAQITTLGFVSGSYLTSLSGAISSSSQLTSSYDARYLTIGGDSVISGSSQLTSSFDTRYALSASFVSSPNVASVQTITSASYAALTPVSGTLYIIIG